MAKQTPAAYALTLIRELLGPRTEYAYRDLYYNSPVPVIRTSLMNILGAYLGSTEAQYELNKFDAISRGARK